jgi:tetratricopeptide (TPR) repeat protein
MKSKKIFLLRRRNGGNKGRKPHGFFCLGPGFLRLLRGFAVSLLLFCIGCLSLVRAQVSQTTSTPASQFNPLDNTNVPARVAAMGSAFVGVADGPSALFFNPAGLASQSHGEIALVSSLGWLDTFRETAVVGLPLARAGGMALSGSYFGYGSFVGRDEAGSLAPDYSADLLTFQAGWGIEFLPQLALGLGAAEWQQTIAGSSYSFLLPDLGVLWRPTESLKLGLDYANPVWGSWKGSLVSTLKAGASWEATLDSATRFLAAVGGSVESNSVDGLQAGVEVSYQSRFFLRAGYQTLLNGQGYGGFSVGAGAALAGIVLDYAYSPYGDLGDTHRFSISYPFETSAPSNPALGSQAKGGTAKPAGETGSGTSGPASAPSNPGTGNAPGTAGATMPAAPVTVFSAGPPSVRTPSPDTGKKDQDRLTLRFDMPADFTSQGDAMAAQGRPSDAIDLYQQALQQDPHDILAWWGLGNVYYQTKQKADAVRCFQKVLELKPDNKSMEAWLEKYKSR